MVLLILPQLFFVLAWLFLFPRTFFILQQLFYFAVAFLFCHRLFILPWLFCFAMTFQFCRDFFILPWLFCLAVVFALQWLFVLPWFFLFCGVFFVLPWLFSFAVKLVGLRICDYHIYNNTHIHLNLDKKANIWMPESNTWNIVSRSFEYSYRDYFLRKVMFFGLENLYNLFQFVRKK